MVSPCRLVRRKEVRTQVLRLILIYRLCEESRPFQREAGASYGLTSNVSILASAPFGAKLGSGISLMLPQKLTPPYVAKVLLYTAMR